MMPTLHDFVSGVRWNICASCSRPRQHDVHTDVHPDGVPARRTSPLQPGYAAQQTIAQLASANVALECPSCNAPVFVPGDSDGEIVTCVDMDCGLHLITRRALGGEVALVVMDPQPDSAP